MINEIIFCLFLAITGGLGTLFLSFIIGDPHSGENTPGRIASFYGRWIERRYEAKEQLIQSNMEAAFKAAAEEAEQINKAIGKITVERILDIQNKHERRVKRVNWWKAAGMCPLCFNVYFTTAVFITGLFLYPVNIIFILPCIFISNQLVRRLM